MFPLSICGEGHSLVVRGACGHATEMILITELNEHSCQFSRSSAFYVPRGSAINVLGRRAIRSRGLATLRRCTPSCLSHGTQLGAEIVQRDTEDSGVCIIELNPNMKLNAFIPSIRFHMPALRDPNVNLTPSNTCPGRKCHVLVSESKSNAPTPALRNLPHPCLCLQSRISGSPQHPQPPSATTEKSHA